MNNIRKGFLVFMVLAIGAASVAAQSGATGDRRDPSPARTHALTVTANVRNAEIYIDGVRQRQTTPATFTLRPGNYTIRVEARGYDSWQTRVVLTSDQTIRAQLVPPTATVILQIPAELLNDRVRDPWRLIDFYLDGRLRNEARIEVDPGYHDVTLVSGGLKLEREFFFEAGRVYTLELFMRLDSF